MRRTGIWSLVLVILAGVACGTKPPQAPVDPRTPAQKAFETADKFAAENPADAAGAEQKFRECAVQFALSEWGAKALARAGEINGRRAEAALAEAEQFRAATPADAAGAAALFRRVMETFPGSPCATRAEAAVKELEKPRATGTLTWHAAGNGVSPMEIILVLENGVLPQGAVLTWKVFSETLPEQNLEVRHRFERTGNYFVTLEVRLKGEVIGAFNATLPLEKEYCQEAFDKERAAIEELVRAGRFDDAREAAARVSGWGIDAIKDATGMIVLDIDRTLVGLQAYYKELFKCYDAALPAFDHARAVAVTDARLRTDLAPLERGIIEQEMARLKLAAGVYNDISLAFADRKGEEFRVGGISGRITGVGDGKVFITTTEGTDYSQGISLMRAEELMPIVEAMRDRLGPFKFGTFLEYLGRFDDARAAYQSSNDPGKDRVVAYLEFKRGLFTAFTGGKTVAAKGRQAVREEVQRQTDLGMALSTLIFDLLRDDLTAVSIAGQYKARYGYPDWNQYAVVCHKLNAIAIITPAERRACQKEKADLEAAHPEFQRYAELQTQIEKYARTEQVNKFKDEAAAIRARWDLEIKTITDQFAVLVARQKERLVQIEEAYTVGMRSWSVDTFKAFLDSLGQAREDIRIFEKRKLELRRGEGQEDRYARLDKETRAFLLWQGRYSLMCEQGIDRINNYLTRVEGENPVFTEDWFTKIHSKIFLDLYLERARLEQSRYVQGK
ncbi:MAG: hypothetical protein ABIF71_02860 [Planctomycetota bacterium]